MAKCNDIEKDVIAPGDAKDGDTDSVRFVMNVYMRGEYHEKVYFCHAGGSCSAFIYGLLG